MRWQMGGVLSQSVGMPRWLLACTRARRADASAKACPPEIARRSTPPLMTTRQNELCRQLTFHKPRRQQTLGIMSPKIAFATERGPRQNALQQRSWASDTAPRRHQSGLPLTVASFILSGRPH